MAIGDPSDLHARYMRCLLQTYLDFPQASMEEINQRLFVAGWDERAAHPPQRIDVALTRHHIRDAVKLITQQVEERSIEGTREAVLNDIARLRGAA